LKYLSSCFISAVSSFPPGHSFSRVSQISFCCCSENFHLFFLSLNQDCGELPFSAPTEDQSQHISIIASFDIFVPSITAELSLSFSITSAVSLSQNSG